MGFFFVRYHSSYYCSSNQILGRGLKLLRREKTQKKIGALNLQSNASDACYDISHFSLRFPQFWTQILISREIMLV